jgi:hypothetical protein
MGGSPVWATADDRVRTRRIAPRTGNPSRPCAARPPAYFGPAAGPEAGLRDYAFANSRLSWYSFSEPRNNVLSMRP